MSDKKLAIMGVIAAAMTAAAILISLAGQSQQTTNLVIGPLVGGLDVDTVAKIAISGEKGTQKVTLAKVDGRFAVAEKDNYPASAKKVNELVNACLDIRTAELCTEDPAFHADLGVSDQTAKSQVTFSDSQDKPIVGVLISENQKDSQGAYVRMASENKAYLTTQAPWINSKPMDYIDNQLLQVDSKKITEVAVTDPNNKTYTLKGEKDGEVVTLAEMPEGKQFKAADYRRVFTALTSLTFDDVTLKEKLQGLIFGWQYVCTLSDSTVYTLKLAKKDNKTYLDIAVVFTDTSKVVKEQGVESEAQLKEKEAKLLARDAADTLGKKTAKWFYVIPDSKAGDLTKELNALIETIPPKVETKADPNQPVPVKAETPKPAGE